MLRFRIHRLKEAQRQSFRWAPHVSGSAQVRPKDYEAGAQVEASHEYAVWAKLKESPEPLAVGDLLESESGELRICKYVGFEKALWVVPETSPQPSASPANL